MWVIYIKRGKVVLSLGYHQYWASRQDALTWAEKEGFRPHEIEVLPILWN